MDMSGINDIIASLSSDDIQKLQSVANSILGNNGNNAAPPAEKKSAQEQPDFDIGKLLSGLGGFNGGNTPPPPSADSQFSLNPEMLGKISMIMQRLNSVSNDKRYVFLTSLKPMLSAERQKRADDAIRMLRLFELLPLLKDSGIFNNIL